MADRRSAEYQAKFNLPPHERLIATFVCALQQDILRQGKLYLSQNFVCFYSKVFGKVASVIIPASEITGVTLAKSLGVVPNAIKIFTAFNQYWLGSFVHRNQAYELICKVQRGESFGESDMVSEQSQRSRADSDASSAMGEDNQPAAHTIANDEDDSEATPQPKRKQRKASARTRQPVVANQDDDDEHVQPQSFTARLDDSNRRAPVLKPRQNDDDDDDNDDDGRGAGIASTRRMNGKSPAKANGRAKRIIVPDDEDNAVETITVNVDGDGEDEDNLAADNDNSDVNEDDEIIRKLKNAQRRTSPGDGSNFSYPPLSSPTDSSVDKAHASIRKQPKGFSVSAPGRRLIHENFLDRQGRWGRWSVVQRWCYLFSDMFIFTKVRDPINKVFEMKQCIPLDGLTVDARPAKLQLQFLRKTQMPHPFRLIYTVPTGIEPPSPNIAPLKAPVEYVVSAGAELARKQAWLTKLELTIAAFHYNQAKYAKREFGWFYHYVLGTPHQAVYDNDKELFQALFDESPAVIDATDLEGRHLLHICAEKQDGTMIPTLVEKGANVSEVDRDGLTAIHIAARHGNIEVMNALMTSVTNGNEIEFALLHGGNRAASASLKTSSALWLTALGHQNQWTECFNLVLSLCRASARKSVLDERDTDSLTLLETAAAEGATEVVEFLVRQGASIDAQNRQGLTPLAAAAKKGDRTLVKQLIAAGAQPNRRFHPSLQTALHFTSDIDTAIFLASAGARTAMKSARNVRPIDSFGPSNIGALTRAESLHAARPPVDTEDPMHPQATTHGQNSNHSLDSCVVCQDDFNVIQRKREYCRRCGLNVCAACSTKKLIFRRKRNGKKERVLARVCDGCFNICAFRLSGDGGIGQTVTKPIKTKKRNENAEPERSVKSRRGAPSVSRKWEDIESEEDDDHNGSNEHAVNAHTGGTDDDTTANDSPVEDGGGIRSNLKAGFKAGMKGALKVGGLIGGKLTTVFDQVTDTLTNVAVPKEAVRRGGAVNDRTQPDDDDESQHDDDAEEVTESPMRGARPAKVAGRASSRAATSASDARQSALRARTQAAANLNQMHEMEDKAGNIAAEAQSFGSLAAQLKAKSKKGKA